MSMLNSDLGSDRNSGLGSSDEGGDGLLFGLSGIDLDRELETRRSLERVIPHRGQMLLLDGVLWTDELFSRGVGFKDVRDDEFWVPGHFPARPLMPGVLQVETAAQFCCYLFNKRMPEPQLSAFLRIEDCVFRSSVLPGKRLLLLAEEIKRGRRRFVSRVQGVVDGQVAFEATLSGLSLGPANLDEANAGSPDG